MPNSLDRYKARHFVGPHLSPNGLTRYQQTTLEIKLLQNAFENGVCLTCLSRLLHIYSTTKETHQSLVRAIIVKQLRNENIFYTIFFNNHLCIKLLNNVTV